MKIIGFFLFFISLSGTLHAQTKKAYAKPNVNFGCTFEDGFFEASIVATKGNQAEHFKTPVYIQGCQVLSIHIEKVPKDWWVLFPPTDIDDAGNTLIKAEKGIQYEVHLILP